MNVSVIFAVGAALLSFYLVLIESYWINGTPPSFFSNAKEFTRIASEFLSGYFPGKYLSFLFGCLWIPVYASLSFSFQELKKQGSVFESFPKESGFLTKSLWAAVVVGLFGNVLDLLLQGNQFGFRFVWIEAAFVVSYVLGIGFLGIRIRSENGRIAIFFTVLTVISLLAGYYFYPLLHAALFPISVGFSFLLLGGASSPWILRFSEWIGERASNKRILLFIGASVLVSGSMQLLEQMTPVPEGASLPVKLDFRPFSTAKDVETVFGIYGETGRNLYFWGNVLDMILPIPVCLMIGSIYSRVAAYLNFPRIWNVLPFGFLVFDPIENAIMMYLLYVWPIVPEGLVATTGTITFLKLTFVLFGYALLFGGLLVSAIVFVFKKLKN
ncbi:hypothetical protein [Leptospira yasudae]|uniref:Uncharacterized protein n=1 Tax=Leptospira yasudae TaxID=2202201 RepID=A0A6N4QYG4_9LEPT|nr:hypothetical protein [Leptospira yasudae]TGL78006.1 hypothetical protein EHQ72_10995 [Leptospira yasudae]TGL82349.1 hypothetical protein EHQ77_04640 [Leptospira yasudae]TGL88980.1 hypothetical protein EHQ83_01990 [Leptospira yasudae]